MALDQFKTQVLLLHSEQSMLDALSSGLGDRYTVHQATSGSEALNTLGQTPINVIISAQDLPGMSGVEALREAKKRSPETVGILLAGGTTSNLEALVGAEEVFEVVQGNVTGDSLTKLVEKATQQVRLVALAESANDTTAGMEDTSEHIVMETSENGSSVITGTRRSLSARRSDRGPARAALGSRTVDIMVLTSDGEFLTTVKESSRGLHNVHCATTVKQADDIIREHTVGVAVIDAGLVGQQVEQLTQHLRQGSPRVVSIIAGRREDGEMLMDLINRGKVYRFLLKPVSPGRARLAIEASIKHHLEAPDAAFKIEGGRGDKAKAGPTATARPRTTSQPAASASRPGTTASTGSASAPITKPSDSSLEDTGEFSPFDEGLSAAFAAQESSLKETVSDLLNTVGDALKGKKDVSAHAQDDAPIGPGGPRIGKLVVLGIAVAAVAAIAGGLYWLTSGTNSGPAAVPAPADAAVVADTGVNTEPVKEPVGESVAGPAPQPVAESAAEPVVESAVEPVIESAVDLEAMINEGRLARDAGRIINPDGANALELFAAAVEADPSNDIAAVELDAVIQDALAMAEAALLQSRSDEAAAALQRVAQVDPDNARLPFLTVQLSQAQLRTYLAAARIAIRDARYQDAANLLAAARNLDIADRSGIDVVAAELEAARSDQRVDEVLVLASNRLQEGALLQPPNDNARYYYEIVLANNPSNPTARQGLNTVASRLVLQARSAIDAGNLDGAEDLIASARAIDGRNGDLAATQSELVAAREAIAARVRRAAEQERQAAAQRIADQQRAEEGRRAAAAAAAVSAPAAEQLADTAPNDAGDRQAAQSAADPRIEEVAGPTVAAAVPGPDNAGSQEPVSISSLTRTRYVAPKYPRTAERRGDSGWVDVLFTVAVDGTVKDVAVRESSPEGTFDNAAIRAVERWTFEPVVENGAVVEKRAGVRMMFAIEN